jgi:hypothetical protein
MLSAPEMDSKCCLINLMPWDRQGLNEKKALGFRFLFVVGNLNVLIDHRDNLASVTCSTWSRTGDETLL